MEQYIEEVVKKKRKEKQVQEFSKKKLIFDLVTQFVETKHLIAYGGIALNNILPKSKKIYGKYDVPDYDCLSYKAKEHSIELVNLLYENGIEYTEVRPAVHEGTFKVFANFVAVADFTQISEKLFLRLTKMSEDERQIHKANDNPRLTIVPLHIIKHYLLKEFARPEGSIYRWRKLIERYKRLEDAYYPEPLKENTITAKKGTYTDNPHLEKLINDLDDVIRLRQFPLVGSHAIKILTGKFARVDEFFSVFDILAKNPHETYKNIFSFIEYDHQEIKIIVSKRFYHPEILPRRIRVFAKVRGQKELFKLMTIIDTETNCYSTIKRNGYLLGSPFTILQLLYAYMIIYRVYEEPRISEYVQMMINTLEYHIKMKAVMQELFSTECYGHEKTLDTIRRERWNGPNKIYLYRPQGRSRRRTARAS
jgi:hypothetical protein